MDNFIFLPASSKVSAGNSATGALSVALGQNCIASGDYSFADGSGCVAEEVGAFAVGIDCRARGACGIAMGYKCDVSGTDYQPHNPNIAIGNNCFAMGCQAIAMGMDCSATGCRSIAMGVRCEATTNVAIAMGNTCHATGKAAIAIGQYCEADASGAVALGWSCKAQDYQCVALGNAADASGTGGFVYRSNAGNTFIFDDASPPSLKINGSAVGSAAALSFRVAYAGAGQSAVAWGTLTSFATSFPALPNDTRLISVTAWTLGDGNYCGGGVTFNIPSSELRTWYWGLNSVAAPNVGGYRFRVWNSVNGGTVVGTEQGFQWTGRGSVTGVGTSWPAGGGTGGATDIKYWFAPALNSATQGGSYCVPGASVVSVFPVQSKLWTESDSIPGIKVQWIG